MSELRFEIYAMPGAAVGSENPLAPFHAAHDVNIPSYFEGLADEMNRNLARGRLLNYMPYTRQDGYDRRRSMGDYRVAVLENDILRAVFLLELGGRLWSLFHKPSGRELLHSNAVLQPANLAMRNAWFAGGVEWNIGAIAHTAFTCEPLFAARVDLPGGTPVLRMYEWERIRKASFQIDAYLPDGSPVLFIRVRIANANGHEIPMYWWSNMAVPETPQTRVIVPADAAYQFSSGRDQLEIVPVPFYDGRDVSYPTNSPRTMDYFFDISQGRRFWITALDETGQGLIQLSTRRLQGRKLFIWGQDAGGRRWQRFLSPEGGNYLEIQAGLAPTQLEHLSMPANSEWCWLEGYGLMSADPALVHGEDWTDAQLAVESQLDRLLPQEALEVEYARGDSWADLPPSEIVQWGSGWGALEALRRERMGEKPFCSDALVFDRKMLTVNQQGWLELLETGLFPESSPDLMLSDWMVQDEWRSLLERALQKYPDSGWRAWMHLGVMRYQAGDIDGARTAWEQSLSFRSTPWVLRNLGWLEWHEKRYDAAVNYYMEALDRLPSLVQMAIEAGNLMLEADRAADWLDTLDRLPASVQQHGRIRLIEGAAALAVNDFDRVAGIFETGVVVNDLREGELSLSKLWLDYHVKRVSMVEGIRITDKLRARIEEEYPVPAEFDFRM